MDEKIIRLREKITFERNSWLTPDLEPSCGWQKYAEILERKLTESTDTQNLKQDGNNRNLIKTVLFRNGKIIRVSQETANLLRDFKMKHKESKNRTLTIGILKDTENNVTILIEVDDVIAIY